jgi:hypothetical protein
MPTEASPIPNAAMPCSHNGVLNTQSVPYFSFRLIVHLNTPPNFTSSPNINVFLSDSIYMSNALFIAWNMFIFSVLWVGTSAAELYLLENENFKALVLSP